MSNRGFLVTSPGPRSKIVAETAHSIPPVWLAFLSPKDVAAAEHPGVYNLDRREAVARGVASLPFLAGLFPEVPTFADAAGDLLLKLSRSRSRRIGIAVTDLLEELLVPDADGSVPTIGMAVRAIEGRDADASFSFPARMVANPFLPGTTVRRGGMTLSVRELVLAVCLIQPRDLVAKSRGGVRETLIGHVWE
jgi:hypothetical protein